MELFIDTINVLDVLHWVNASFKEKHEQVDKKEFFNDAVNKNLDLRPQMMEWANRTKVQIRNKVPITHSNNFNPCSFAWLMTPHNKTLMLQRYNMNDWQFNVDFFILRAFWDPQLRQRLSSAQKFQLEISRDNILDDSLQKVVQVKTIDGYDPLKLPIVIRFAGEPGIDEGGVRKEYFSLVTKELLS